MGPHPFQSREVFLHALGHELTNLRKKADIMKGNTTRHTKKLSNVLFSGSARVTTLENALQLSNFSFFFLMENISGFFNQPQLILQPAHLLPGNVMLDSFGEFEAKSTTEWLQKVCLCKCFCASN